jgi:hypothetical protein
MIIKAKIYGDKVTIKNGVAYSENKTIEEIVNFVSKTSGLGGPSYRGYLPTLKDIFGDNYKLIDVEDEPKDAIH